MLEQQAVAPLALFERVAAGPQPLVLRVFLGEIDVGALLKRMMRPAASRWEMRYPRTEV